MILPTISTPTYEVTLLSRKDPVKFRPFLVKEQKLMLMASENKNNSDEITSILKQIAKNCILDPSINVDDLPLVDLEILFLHLRARSMGEVINSYFKCRNKVENSECGMVMEVPVNLLEVPTVNLSSEKKIMITDKVGVMMKFPTFEIVTKLMSKEMDEDPDSDIKAAAMNIDYIFDENGVYKASEASLQDLVNFLYSIPPEKYNEIESFFDNLPTVQKEIDHKCTKCGYEHHLVLEGLNDFFI